MANHSWIVGILLKIVNVVVFIVGYSLYPVGWPKDPHTSKETYITPAPWAFSIWSLIHFLLLGAIVYQFTPAGKRVVIDSISWRLPLLLVLSVVYKILSAYAHYISAFVLELLVWTTVTHTYYVVQKRKDGSVADEVLVRLPFSLYHGCATVLVVLAAFEAFGVNEYEQLAGAWTKAFVIFALLSLELTAAAYAFSTAEGDVAGAVAISWSLGAIFVHQTSDAFVHWSALAFAMISLLWVVKSAVGLVQHRRGVVREDVSERTPLVSA